MIWFCVSLAGCDTPGVSTLSGYVEGMSMAPGVRDGEVISWLPAQTDVYQRYERVVCKYKDELITKRIMGLPGESIQITDGEVFIDGQILRKSPCLLQQFGLIVDCQPDSWRDSTRSWRKLNNIWTCENVSPQHFSWLEFQPQVSRGVVPDINGVHIYDDVSWLPTETRRLEVVRDVGISAVLDIDLQEGCGLEIRVTKDQHIGRLIVKKCGLLAVIAGRLDEQFVVTAWPITRDYQEIDDGYSGEKLVLSYDLPEEWSAQWEVPDTQDPDTQEKPRNVSSLSLGIKLLSEVENTSSRVSTKELFVWRDVYWLSMPNKRTWSVPAEHVFVLGDCPAASRDSRHWGPIAVDTIQGTVVQSSLSEPFPFWLHQN